MTREDKAAHVLAALRVTIERLQVEKDTSTAKLRDQLHALSIVGDGRRDLKESALPTRRRVNQSAQLSVGRNASRRLG